MRWLLAALSACVLAVGSVLPAAARPEPLPATVASAPAASWVPLLWEVRGQGQARVLLLGSIHLLEPADYPLPAEVQQAYAQADRVVFELAPEQMLSAELAQAMLRAAARRSGRLQDDLSPAQWQRLLQWAQQRQMPVERLQLLKPWFAALTISLQEMAAAGLQAELGLDRHLMQRARADGKSVLGLEDGLAQIALFDAMGHAEQQQILAEALDEADSNGARSQRLLQAWRSGEPAAFWAQAGEPLKKDYPALYQSINVQRNTAWLAQLPQWLQDGHGTTLVVVGAMHLVGSDGLVQRLQSQGYKVQRLCRAGACPNEQRRRSRR